MQPQKLWGYILSFFIRPKRRTVRANIYKWSDQSPDITNISAWAAGQFISAWLSADCVLCVVFHKALLDNGLANAS